MSVGSIGLASNLKERDGFFYPANSITQLIGHDRVGPIGLERFEYDLELKFGAISALTHGAYRWIDSRFTGS